MALLEGRGKLVAAIVAGAIVVVSIVVLIRFYQSNQPLPTNQIVRDFFVDENTMVPQTHTIYELPPLAGKDGRPTVVIAVYCHYMGSNEQMLQYLYKYPDDVKASLEADLKSHDGHPGDDFLWIGAFKKILVRRPEPGSKWVDVSSPEGAEIVKMPMDPQGRPAMPYMPQ